MNEDKLILYNSDGTPFHGIYLTTFSFTDNVMAETFLSGSFKYDGTLLDSEFDKTQYTIYKQNKYYIFDAPTVSMKYDDGLVKYDVKFIPEKVLLKNIPFTDEVTEGTENRYFTSSRDVKFFGDIREFVGRLNAVLLKNAPSEGNNTQWTAELQADIKTESFEINLSNVFVTDALKTMYETYDVPYYIENRKILIGKPNFKVSKVFEYDQNKGLCGITKTPKNNKVVTRITGHGSEDNIPFRYPIIRRNNGEVVEHSYTRPYLMPSIYVDCVNKKVNPDAEGYNPNIHIIDYYDAIGEDYVTQINNEFPSFQIQDFPEIKPTIQDIKYPLNEDGSDKPNAKFIDTLAGVRFDPDDNNNIDPETGDVEHPYFIIQLHPMGFDLYGSAIETGEMTFAMKSGACAGCEFKAAIDYDLWKKNFYVKEGDKLVFRPGTPEKPAPQRDTNKFPYTNYQSIEIRVYKDLDTFGTLLPIQPFIVPKVGDKFVILHIDLPQKYVDEAQDKLDQSLKQFMKENNFDKYSFSSDFDEKFLIENQSVLDQFKTNSLVDIKYNDKIIELSVTQLSISYDENKPLPSFKFTLSDEIQINYNSIQQVANDLEDTDFIVQQNQIKGAKDAANFYKGLKVVEKGLFDADGNNRIGTVESLVLKSNALFVGNDSSNFAIQNGREHLNINGDQGQLNFDAGTIIHFSVSRSEEYDISFASWNVDSLSKTGLVANVMYYVYVVANRNNDSAQFKITIDQIIWNSDPNVYHFLWGQLVQTGTDRTAYKTYGMSALMGGVFTGQLLRSPNYSYEKKQGMEIDLLNATIRSYVTIEGQINVVAGSKGADKFEEWKQVEDIQDYTDNILPNELSYLQNQIDGVIDSWFFSYTPTLSNKPASDWTTVEEKRRHIGDTFTNTQQYIDDKTTPDAGKSWRFLESNGTFNWDQIADSDAVKALLEAAKAQDTADQKRRTFISQPTTPYDKGDLWVQGGGGDIMRCMTSRLSGNFLSSDWDKASKYTDDTAANEAKTAAANAQNSANTASQAVGSLKTYIDGSFNDGVIESSEAIAIEKYINSVNETKLTVTNTYNTLYSNVYLEGVAKTNLSSAKSGFDTAINNLISAINTAIADKATTAAEKANVDAKFSVFNTAYSTLNTRIEEANKAIQDKLKNFSDAAKSAADNAHKAANNAQESADSANNKLTSWSSDSIISPPEKTGLKQQQNDIKSEYVEISAQSDRYALKSTTAWNEYNQYYGLANTALTKYSASTPTEISVVSDYNNIAIYYSKRQVILNSIASAAKKIADDAAVSAGEANNKADGLVYLKKVFGSGVVAGDVVLGGFVGVSNVPDPINNPNAKIVAGIAGYVPSGQTKYPMIFAGAVDAANANNALFRVYNTGKMHAVDADISGMFTATTRNGYNFIVSNEFVGIKNNNNNKILEFYVDSTDDFATISLISGSQKAVMNPTGFLLLTSNEPLLSINSNWMKYNGTDVSYNLSFGSTYRVTSNNITLNPNNHMYLFNIPYRDNTGEVNDWKNLQINRQTGRIAWW